MTDITQRHVGVSGRREGMTPAQEHAFFGELITELRSGATHFHHGACTGLDLFAHFHLMNQLVFTVTHPPVDKKFSAEGRMLRHGRRIDLEAKPYGERNLDIVNGLMPDGSENPVSVLLAAPAYPEDDERSKRSGTWQTVRMADDAGIPVRIVDDAGTVSPYVRKVARSRKASATSEA